MPLGYLTYKNLRKLIINPRNICPSSEASKHFSRSQETPLLSWNWRFIFLFIRTILSPILSHKNSVYMTCTPSVFKRNFKINLLHMPKSPSFLQLIRERFLFLYNSSNAYFVWTFCLIWHKELNIWWISGYYKLQSSSFYLFSVRSNYSS
jgi:hypothetical protein